MDASEVGSGMTQGISIRFGPTAGSTPHWKEMRAGACLAMFLSITCAGQNGSTSSVGFRPEKVPAVSPINEHPDANKLQELNTNSVQIQKFAAVNAERKRQIGDDSARLLQFAAELNAQLAKTESTDSPQEALARAEMIEKLAHAVKEKMKLTMAAQ